MMHSQSLGRRRPGFSLIEILLAMVVMGLMLVPIWNHYAQSRSVLRVGQHDFEVMNLGMSFAVQAALLPSGALSVQPLKPVVKQAGGVIEIAGNKLFLPDWDSARLTLSTEISEILPSGPLQKFWVVKLVIKWPEVVGGERVCAFPVVIPSRSSIP